MEPELEHALRNGRRYASLYAIAWMCVAGPFYGIALTAVLNKVLRFELDELLFVLWLAVITIGFAITVCATAAFAHALSDIARVREQSVLPGLVVAVACLLVPFVPLGLALRRAEHTLATIDGEDGMRLPLAWSGPTIVLAAAPFFFIGHEPNESPIVIGVGLLVYPVTRVIVARRLRARIDAILQRIDDDARRARHVEPVGGV